jgi:hypothetical protein
MPNTSKTLIVGLAVLSAILAIISITLGIMLYRQQRFVPANGNSPYIMFDTRTAQACWSGPPITSADANTPSVFEKFGITPNTIPCTNDPFKKYGGKMLGCPQNPSNLPFCKDLK